MDLSGSVSTADELGQLVDTLCTKFGCTKPSARTGQPYAREADLVAVIRSLDSAFRKCISEKDESINALRAEIGDLRSRVETLERKPASAAGATLSWSKITAGLAHKDENAVAIMATISTEMKKKEERANNVVIATSSTNLAGTDNAEFEYAKTLAKAMGVPEEAVKTARRIGRKPESSVSNEPALVVVEMVSTSYKKEMLRESRNLRNKPEYKNVYVNEDFTPSERIADRKLRQERDRRNAELPEETTFEGRSIKFKTCEDKKRRFWGIRNGELRLVLSAMDRPVRS